MVRRAAGVQGELGLRDGPLLPHPARAARRDLPVHLVGRRLGRSVGTFRVLHDLRGAAHRRESHDRALMLVRVRSLVPCLLVRLQLSAYAY